MAFFAVNNSNKGQRYQEAEQAGNQQKDNETLWRVSSWEPITVFTWALVVVGGSQAALFVWQLNLIRDGANDAKEAAGAANKSAKIAAAQLRLVERLERPWLHFVPPAFGKVGYRDNPQVNQFPEIDFTFENAGRSPAIVERADIIVVASREPPTRRDGANGPFVMAVGATRTVESYTQHNWNYGLVAPGDRLALSNLPAIALMPDQATEIATGTQQIWLDGRVHYRDAFDQPRATQFRFVYDYLFDMFIPSGGRDFNWFT